MRKLYNVANVMMVPATGRTASPMSEVESTVDDDHLLELGCFDDNETIKDVVINAELMPKQKQEVNQVLQ